MSEDYSENVALFSKPQNTYTGQHAQHPPAEPDRESLIEGDTRPTHRRPSQEGSHGHRRSSGEGRRPSQEGQQAHRRPSREGHKGGAPAQGHPSQAHRGSLPQTRGSHGHRSGPPKRQRSADSDNHRSTQNRGHREKQNENSRPHGHRGGARPSPGSIFRGGQRSEERAGYQQFGNSREGYTEETGLVSDTRDAAAPTPPPPGDTTIKETAVDGGMPPERGGMNIDEVEETPPLFDEVLGTVHEKALSAAGFGRLQWTLFVVLGLGIMGDGIELMVIAYILPGAERELCMNEQMKGWLGAIAFAGMMVGATLWGNMADKIGRRITLITALLINATFSIIAAFVPTYWLFLVCRLLSGIGIGGSIPVVFAYFAEFCPLHGRGQKLGFLLIFWVMGGIYVSGLGWLIIPKNDLQFTIMETYVFASWRVFMLICTVPIILSILGLLVMPESPRYLLQAGKDLDSLGVYRMVYKWNHTEPGAEYEMPEIELPNRIAPRPNAEPVPKGVCAEVARGLENFWNSIFQLFFPPLTTITLVLCVTWFSIAFGYYGLTIWFPEYMKKLEQSAYFAQREMIKNSTFYNQTITGLLDNVYYFNSTFDNVAFNNVTLQHVTFDMCMLRKCSFENVTARKSYFLESRISYSSFNNTNLYQYKFQGTYFKNISFENLREGCEVDFDINFSSETVFLENFLGQLAVVPGTIITALMVDKIGRVRMLAGSLFLSGVSVFFIWFTDTEIAVVAINCVFNFVVVGAWNSLDIVSTELYPTQLRTTAFGFQSCLGRIAAILGNVAFGNFLSVSKAIPILLTAAIMAIGGFLTIKLPESKNRLM